MLIFEQIINSIYDIVLGLLIPALLIFEQIIDSINAIVWGPLMLTLLLGTGIFLTIGLRGITIARIPYAFRQLFKGRKGSGEGEISPFNALMTALSSTVGTGNIAGVATAVGLGGPGAL